MCRCIPPGSLFFIPTPSSPPHGCLEEPVTHGPHWVPGAKELLGVEEWGGALPRMKHRLRSHVAAAAFPRGCGCVGGFHREGEDFLALSLP